MDTEEIIWLVVAIAVALALIALVAWLLNKKKAEKQERERIERRERAGELRQEADKHAAVLPEAELRAKEEEVRAEKLRREAREAEERAQEAQVGYQQQAAVHEDRLREADRLDPDGTASGTRRSDDDPDTVLDDRGHDASGRQDDDYTKGYVDGRRDEDPNDGSRRA